MIYVDKSIKQFTAPWCQSLDGRSTVKTLLFPKTPQHSRYNDNFFEVLLSYGIQWGSFRVNVTVRGIATRNSSLFCTGNTMLIAVKHQYLLFLFPPQHQRWQYMCFWLPVGSKGNFIYSLDQRQSRLLSVKDFSCCLCHSQSFIEMSWLHGNQL